MITKEHGSLPNVMLLYKAALKRAKMFDAVFMTTDIKNKVINKLLGKSTKANQFLKIKSPFGSNKLFVWQVGKSEEGKEIISKHFDEYVIEEY